MNNYSQKLIEYLIRAGYDKDTLNCRDFALYQGEKQYSLVEVKDKESNLVIQAFLLMSEDSRSRIHRYPVYKTYTQTTPKGNRIFPACCIACCYNDSWSFYNASETCEPVINNFVNYKAARERFQVRIDREIQLGTGKQIRTKCYTCGGFLLLYMIAYIFGFLPLNESIIILFILAVIMFILPDLLNIIYKVTYKGVDVLLNADMEK